MERENLRAVMPPGLDGWREGRSHKRLATHSQSGERIVHCRVGPLT